MNQEQLKNRLSYCPKSGIVTWKVVGTGRAKAGSRAGNLRSNGYRYIKFLGKNYSEHRLIFLYMTGSFPDLEVDHVNLCKSDNRWENLRIANRSQNSAYARTSKVPQSGHRGVRWDQTSKRWRVRGTKDQVTYNLGSYVKIEDAVEAAKKWRIQTYGEFAMH